MKKWYAVPFLSLYLLGSLPVIAAAAPVDVDAMVNQYRAAHRLPVLALSADLSAAAQEWADHLADTNTLAHVARITGPWSVVAENVGRGGSIEAIQRAFEASASHEHNLVGPYTHLGVAVAVRGQIVWVVQRFGVPAKAMTRATSGPLARATTTTTTTTTGVCR